MDLEGKTALVTGSSKNIGRQIAVSVAEAGADVGVTAHSDREGCEETARLVERAGGESHISLCELQDPDQITRMMDNVQDELGSIDVLVNNATTRPQKPFAEITVDDWNYVCDVNLRSMFLTTQLVAPEMAETGSGSVINLLGALVYLGDPSRVHSFSTKFGIEGLVRALAKELGPDGIRINGISPGLIDTERDHANRSADWKEHMKQVEQTTALKRRGTIEEVADACLFLASDKASYITGQILHVNGGLYPTPDIR
ncbi:SDR family NAD(P)-dependent oxidoreductase [Natronorarus salvus]|uniref:SDR family NAD(P)-dependent oxidoreductase n=1 Tax=Natronorarus salvus TaxID=3117733 RepID=UPI002F26D6A0